MNDKPIFSYRYKEGYQPDAYNKTLTLTEDNMTVTFVYTPIPAATQETVTTTITTTTTTTTTGGTGTTGTGTTGTGTTGGTTGTTGGATGTTGGTGTGGTGTGTGGGTGAGGEEGGATVTTPADIVDLDEGDVPLANPDDQGDEGSATPESNGHPTPLSVAAKTAIGIVIAAVIAVLIAIAAMIKHRKKEDEES